MKRIHGWVLFELTPIAALFSAGLWIAAHRSGAPIPETSAPAAPDLSVGNKHHHYRFSEDDIAPMVTAMANAGISNFIVWIDPNTGALDVVTTFDHKPHLDIKPGSCPNSVNVMHGAVAAAAVVPMSLLGNAFDVTQVDINTVRLSPVVLQEQGTSTVELSPVHVSFEDVGSPFEAENCGCAALGPDGVLDLVIQFDRQEMVDGFDLQSLDNNVELPLKVTGMVTDGRAIFGTRDCIRIINH